MASLDYMRALLIDDDKNVMALLVDTLSAEGCECLTAHSLSEAKRILQSAMPDIIVLDRHLPDGDGADFCGQLKKTERTRNIPVMFVSGTGKEMADRVEGLEAGGDDYLTKPFGVRELLARIKAILRRTSSSPANTALEAGPLRLDLDSRKAYMNGANIDLGPNEFELLRVFLENPNHTLKRDFILDRVWGVKSLKVMSNTVDVTVCGLRDKLGRCGEKIITVRGMGFRFEFPNVKPGRK